MENFINVQVHLSKTWQFHPILNYLYITLLNDIDPFNIIIGCWELNLNLSLHVHLIVISEGP